MSETLQYNIGPSGKCYFCIFIFIMFRFVFKHVYDLKGGKKPRTTIPKTVFALPL